MIHRLATRVVIGAALFLTGSVSISQTVENAGSKVNQRWDFAHPAMWSQKEGILYADISRNVDSHALAMGDSKADLLIQVDVRFAADSPRQNFGFAIRDRDGHRLVLRFYDQPRAMELLEFQGDKWRRIGERSSPVKLSPKVWYSLKAAAVGPYFMAKLWPSGQPEPDWQLSTQVDAVNSGRAGLVVHDAGKFEFRSFRLSSDAPTIRDLQKRLEGERTARLKKLKEFLRLAVVPSAFLRDGSVMRTVEVVPFGISDRYPLAGKLTWTENGQSHTRDVQLDDYRSGAVVFEVPEPKQKNSLTVTLTTPDGIVLKRTVAMEPSTLKPWRHYVQKSIDTLIEHGRDDYGPKRTPLVMAVIDTATLRSPQMPERLDAIVRLEGRIHRRGERGSNLWYDQALINAMQRLTDISGEAKYGEAANAYVSHFLANCNKRKDNRHGYHTGLPTWGTHVYWDCYQERPAGDHDGSGPHEILVFRANWQRMYDLAPKEIQRVADGVWQYHIVNQETGLHNRHDDSKKGCDFAFSGGSFVHLFATMYKVTGDKKYLQQARTVADWHWKNRNQRTDLPADCPGLPGRYDGQHTFTTVSGPHAMLLLEAYRVSGDEYFREIANAYVKSYDKFAWDDKAKTYHAMLTLDGLPLADRKKGEGYGAYAPYGHVNVWRTTFYSYEFTLSAAQAAVQAYELSGKNRADRDPELLTIARRWGAVVKRAMPARTGRRWKDELERSMPLAKETGGVYAEDYGRSISLFVHLYRATNEKEYLALANNLAEDAVRKLYHNGLFKGHPAKPYYETTNGVGILLMALLELDSPEIDLGGSF